MGSLEPTTTENSLVECAGKVCASNPIFKVFAKILNTWTGGLWAIADKAIVEAVNGLKRRRIEAFFDSLSKSNIAFTEGQLSDDDYIHAFVSMSRAAINARSRQRVDELVDLFASFDSYRLGVPLTSLKKTWR